MQILKSVSFPGKWRFVYGGTTYGDNYDCPREAMAASLQWASQS